MTGVYDARVYTPVDVREMLQNRDNLPTVVARALVLAANEEDLVLPFNVYERLPASRANEIDSEGAANPSSPVAP